MFLNFGSFWVMNVLITTLSASCLCGKPVDKIENNVDFFLKKYFFLLLVIFEILTH